MFKRAAAAFLLSLAFAVAAFAAPRIDIDKIGAAKITVTVNVQGGSEYVSTLKRNLEISGFFQVVPNGGSIEVTGNVGGVATIKASGRGKAVNGTSAPLTDAKSTRIAARKMADTLVEVYCGVKGMANTRIVFVDRKGSDNAELYTCYPDGNDIRQITSDHCAAAAPRWANDGNTVYYISWKQKKPLVYRVDSSTGARKLLAPFKGSVTGFSLSPDGNKAAIILSHEGNPELYVLDLTTNRLRRLTTTKNATEASPCWSPDGTKIAYVSDVTRHPKLYIIDVATKVSRRVKSDGIEDVNPDWSRTGKLVWCSKRGGNCIVTMNPDVGESSIRVIGEPARWEHPSWARDGRHVVANDGNDLYLIDTDVDGDKPRRLFGNRGNWMNADWAK